MSINKSQGQSVTKVGLNLQFPVFTHGQLYVALSQCTTKQGVKVCSMYLFFVFKLNNIYRRYRVYDTKYCLSRGSS
ncbi:hypothetical protein BT96DRAFT_843884 [Gymnopus androsaceus JB14]|uniref:Helicase n=1 Tax=Gymnopus androsaceus JB14 TaxID=1447944 RepID=A0A6A4GCY2_9AGAR|nr:hypothetical protein BT96DRAFT_843884 [Gymnopus androsaceus JB14]